MLKFNVQIPMITPGTDIDSVERAMRAGANLLKNVVVALTPGSTKLGWKTAALAEGVRVYTDDMKSVWLEHGTKPHKIRRHGAIDGKGFARPGREVFGRGSRYKMIPGSINRERYYRVGTATGRVTLRIPIGGGTPSPRFSGARASFNESDFSTQSYAFPVEVTHPGITARYYFRQAKEETYLEILNMLEEAATDKITNQLGRVRGAGGTGTGTYLVSSPRTGRRISRPPRLG